MRAMVPWTGFAGLRKEMDRLFERFGDFDFPELRAMGEWTPSLDVSETKDAFLVKAELPGLDPKEVQVSLEGEVLTVRGEKRQEKEEKDEQFYRVERSWGAFARSVRLPMAVEQGKTSATFKNGVLTVKLPKVPGSKGATIPVKEE